MKEGLPEFGPGDQVRVWYRIREKDRIRQVPFEGLVIRRRGSGESETCTIRRVTHGEGVERIFPLQAPVVERIEVLRQGKVKRARLYYLRAKVGKTRIASSEVAEPPATTAPSPAS
jgi:large subunit ribosomal protein L19